jgi:4-hydroxy-4-methyl-2-oxoglutarate aldolase
METRPQPENQNVVYRRMRRPDPGLVARIARIPVSDLYEVLPADVRDAALMSPRLRPLALGIRIAGPALTARCAPHDNLMMHRALALAAAGDVLVVDGGEPSGAQWGTLAALYAEHKGLAGVVVEGCIRDADELAARRYPVWSTAISPAHPDKRGAGAVNVPIRCGGVLVHPGDVICADGDGVLVLPPTALAGVVEKGERRMAHEDEAAAAIAAGKSLFELHDLDRAFVASGVPERDAHWDDAPGADPDTFTRHLP